MTRATATDDLRTTYPVMERPWWKPGKPLRSAPAAGGLSRCIRHRLRGRLPAAAPAAAPS